MASDNPASSTFYLAFRGGRYALSGLLGVFGLLLVTNYSFDASAPPYSLGRALTGLVLLVGAAYLAYSSAVVRLVISPQGLQYRDIRGTTAADWAQVVAIRRTAGRYGSTSYLELSGSGQLIQLTQFGGDWFSGRLGQALRNYAPHLFKPQSQPPA